MENLEKEHKDSISYYQVIDDTNNITITDDNVKDGVLTVSSAIYRKETRVKEDDEVRTIKINKKELLDKLGLISISIDPEEYIELDVTIIGREYTI